LSYLGDSDPVLLGLREGLRELGYVEGKSLVIVPRFAHGDFTRLPQLVAELGGERLDVVVSRGPSTDYTKAIRARVPVVFV
jgi:putative ABC transport system substrate-binding protein